MAKVLINIEKSQSSSSSSSLFSSKFSKNQDYIKNQNEAIILELKSLKQQLPSKQQLDQLVYLLQIKIKTEQSISILEKKLIEIQEELTKIKESIIEINSFIKK